MMAFLLDIITFLQISFSTNIFRINYIIPPNGHAKNPAAKAPKAAKKLTNGSPGKNAAPIYLAQNEYTVNSYHSAELAKSTNNFFIVRLFSKYRIFI
ncbi:hypothetical protein [Francisella tularensis]|uniref:hypothetical protein n=1 Tax=Francisella tularensis TaxID=263 RepID=UPI001F2FA2D3|nr:hypothetical protein [Francisella tularensis]